MPKEMERALKRRAAQMARSGKLHGGRRYKTLAEAKDAFVYGTLRHKTGWKPSREKHA